MSETLQTACALATALLLADAAGAQDARFELGVQVASAQSGQFDAADADVATSRRTRSHREGVENASACRPALRWPSR